MNINLMEVYFLLEREKEKVNLEDDWDISTKLMLEYDDYLLVGYAWRMGDKDYEVSRYINLWLFSHANVDIYGLMQQEIRHVANSVKWEVTNRHGLHLVD